MFNGFKIKKTFVTIFLILLVVVPLVSVFPKQVEADTAGVIGAGAAGAAVGGLVGNIPGAIVGGLGAVASYYFSECGVACYVGAFIAWTLQAFTSFLGSVVVTLVGLLIKIGQYNDFITAEAVVLGWNVIRDIANMFFVLVLLLISFGTILNIEQYNLKRLLPKVILMAILVNFSKAIAGLFIDFSQVILLTFAAAYYEAGSGNFLQTLGFTKVLQLAAEQGEYKPVTLANLVPAFLLAFIYTLVSFVVVLAFLMIFVVRIVTLWVLIVLSPFAYVLSIVPAGQKYASQWWDMFAKQVIIGPVLAFFLWLSLATLPNITTKFDINSVEEGQILSNQQIEELNNNPLIPPSAIIEAGTPENLLGFIVSIAMLFVSLMFAQQIGGAVGKIAGTAYSKAMSAGLSPFKVAKTLASWGERKLALKTKGATGFLNPVRTIRAWRGYAERKKGHEEAQIGYMAAQKATEHYGEGHGLRGMFYQATGAQEDFFENFSGQPLRFLGTALRGSKYSQEMHERAEESMSERAALAALTKGKGDKKEVIEEGKMALFEEQRQNYIESESNDLYRAISQSLPAYDTYARQKKEIEDEYATKDLTDEDRKEKNQRIKEANEVFSGALNKVVEDNPNITAVQLRQTLEQAEARVSTTDKTTDKTETLSLLDLMKAKGVPLKSEGEGVEKYQVDKFIEDFLKGFAKSRAESKFDKDVTLQEKINARIGNMSEDVLLDAGKKSLAEKAKEKERQADMLARGGYSEKDIENQSGAVENLLRKLVRINQLMAEEAKKPPEEQKDMGSLIRTRNSLVGQVREEKAKRDNMKIGSLPDSKEAIEENKEKNKAEARALRLESAKMKAEILSDEEKKEAEKKLKKYDRKHRREKSVKSIPASFYATRAYRILENEEIGKLGSESMEWEELKGHLATAFDKKDMVQISSLLKKAANDYNDNEVWNDWGFGSGPEGAEQFRKKYLEPLMGEQASMATMSDISYINESHGHSNMSRSYGVRGGVYYKRTKEEQAAAAANESLKQDSRKFLQTKNRLAYGYEDVNGKFHLDLTGKLTIAGFQDDFAYRLSRAEVNPSFLAKLFQDIESLKEMERKGVLTARLSTTGETLVQALERMKRERERRGTPDDMAGLISQARYL